MLASKDFKGLFNSALTVDQVNTNSLALAEAIVSLRPLSGLTFWDGSRSEKWLGNLAAADGSANDPHPHAWSSYQ